MLIILGKLLGGIGLFLLAMKMITDGLSVAAGNSLRDILSRATQTPLRGITAGITITGLVQSSSAITVAIIGFVNAGIITLYQAMGVVYGTNIGTTMTGWLVTAIGFNIKIEYFALPLVGVGMLMKTINRYGRYGAFGETLVGFGLFFVGVDILKDTFGEFANNIDLTSDAPTGLIGLLFYLVLGFLMTLLTQSSSAAIAIILTATTGGLLTLPSAAAMVIGANLGTTSTAALAAIGATPNAKRVAAAHILFNVLTGAVALVILPFMLWASALTGEALGLGNTPAIMLAMFHTLFNVIGVMLMWPITQWMCRLLLRQFVSIEEHESRPQFLDNTTISTPSLAINALTQELQRINRLTNEQALYVLQKESIHPATQRTQETIINKLLDQVGEFVTTLGKQNLAVDVANQLPTALRIGQYFRSASEHARFVAHEHKIFQLIQETSLADHVFSFNAQTVELIRNHNLDLPDFDFQKHDDALRKLLSDYQDLKKRILAAGSSQTVSIQSMVVLLEVMSHIRTMAEQISKGVNRLFELRTLTTSAQENVPSGESTEARA